MAPAREIDQLLHEMSTALHNKRGDSVVSEPGSNAQLAFCDILAFAAPHKKRGSSARRLFIGCGVREPYNLAACKRFRSSVQCPTQSCTHTALYALTTRGQHPLQRLRTQSSRIQQRKNDACT